VFGEKQLDYLCSEYLAHYHKERPHQSLDNEPLITPKNVDRPRTKTDRDKDHIVPLADVRCK